MLRIVSNTNQQSNINGPNLNISNSNNVLRGVQSSSTDPSDVLRGAQRLSINLNDVLRETQSQTTSSHNIVPNLNITKPNILIGGNPPPILPKNINVGNINQRTAAPTGSNYERYTQIQHIYNISDTYIGSDEQNPYITRILDLNDMTMKDCQVSVPEGVSRLFLEILSNATDNSERSRRAGVDMGEINVKMDEQWVSIKNGGVPLPVEIHHKEGIWTPEMIFGVLLTSSNYNQDQVRTVCGRNGYGAKLTNVYSKEFIIDVGDPGNPEVNRPGQRYRQTWTENMSQKTEPIIEPYNGPAYVEIKYRMDFHRFRYTQYPNEAFALFARYASDAGFTCKVPITFNGVKFDPKDPREYAKLFYGDLAENSIIHYEWPKDVEVTKKRNGVQVPKNGQARPMIEMVVIDTPDKGICTSFVNGIVTDEGGVHVNEAYSAVSSSLLNTLNESTDNKKGKKKNANTGTSIKLNISHVKRHLSIILSYWAPDPKFIGQTKNRLSSPKPHIKISEATLKPIGKWNLMTRLYAEIEAMQFKAITKTDGKKKKRITGMKCFDANCAGEVHPSQTVAWIVEGESATGYPIAARDFIPNGNDYIGILALRGKPLNAMNASVLRVAENIVYSKLKEFLGLREGVDYSLEENYKTLRYGHMVIMCDADVDGKHIMGLIINYMYCRFPTLLQRGYIMFLRTPIIRGVYNRQSYKFYTMHEFEQFKLRNPGIDYGKYFRYLKGLGTSEDEDAQDDFKQPRIVVCLYDDSAPDSINLAFNEKLANQRKVWIATWSKYLNNEEHLQQLPISYFINHELVEFSAYTLKRAIPGRDGFKDCQRRIMHGARMRWGKNFETGKEMKVARFASQVSEKTDYHHGENSLMDAVIGMAQNFCGSNNISYLDPKGQFGSRVLAGKDAANGRYIFVKGKSIMKFIFRKEDIPILQFRDYDEFEDDLKPEPKDMYPIIPMSLVNGAWGIATGHSTFIPNHHPLDIIRWLEARIQSQPTPKVLPWYKGFRGNIDVVFKRPKSKENDILTVPPMPEPGVTDDNEYESDDDDDPMGSDKQFYIPGTKVKMVTKGTFAVDKDGRKDRVIVNEIPIGVATQAYETWLGKLLDEKKITNFKNKSTKKEPCFWIYGMKNPSLNNLRLKRSYGMSNMVLLNSDNRPIKYNTVDDLLEEWFQYRYMIYSKRKSHIIGQIEAKIAEHDLRARFIASVITGEERIRRGEQLQGTELAVINKPKAEVLARMRLLNYPDWLATKVKTYEYFPEEIEKHRAKIRQLEAEKNNVMQCNEGSLWLADLAELKTAYIKEYGEGTSNAKMVIAKEKLKDTTSDKPVSPSKLYKYPETKTTPTSNGTSTLKLNVINNKPTTRFNIVN